MLLETTRPTLLVNSLPAQWRTVRLDEAYDFTKKPRNLDIRSYLEIPFVPMEMVPIGMEFFDKFELRSPDEISSGTYFEPGDLLLSKITPSFENGKQGIIEQLPTPFGYATTEVIPIKAIPGVSDQLFLFYYLLRHSVRNDLAGKMDGTTGRQRLNKSTLEGLEIPLPPLPEQRAIAHALRTVQTAREARRREAALERERKAALMQRLFMQGTRGEPTKTTDIGEVPMSWEVVRLGDVAKISSGGTPDRGNPEFWNGNISWVKTGEINYNTITETEETISESGLVNSAAKIVPAGTLLMAMYGQGVTRGRVALLGIDATLNQACAAIAVPDRLVTLFLFHFLAWRYEQIRELGHGANQKNLNAILIRSIQIACPPLFEQRAIAEVLRACDEKIAALEREAAAHDELFKALLEELMTAKRRVAEM